MAKHSLDLPARKPVGLGDKTPEMIVPGEMKFPSFTEKQMDMIVQAKSQAFVQGAQDVGEILKAVLDIVKIRQQGAVDVKRIEAETSKIVASTRVHIELLVQQGKIIGTRGEVVITIISKVTEMLGQLDSTAHAKLIDSLVWLVQAALEKSQ
jgi:hypothetical protein